MRVHLSPCFSQATMPQKGGTDQHWGRTAGHSRNSGLGISYFYCKTCTGEGLVAREGFSFPSHLAAHERWPGPAWDVHGLLRHQKGSKTVLSPFSLRSTTERLAEATCWAEAFEENALAAVWRPLFKPTLGGRVRRTGGWAGHRAWRESSPALSLGVGRPQATAQDRPERGEAAASRVGPWGSLNCRAGLYEGLAS